MNTVSSTTNVESLDAGRLQVAAEFLPLLRAQGLDTFAKVMAFAGGDMMRSVPGRSTVKIGLAQPAGGKQVAFLKRYEREYLSPGKKLLRLIGWLGAGDEAVHEWKAIRDLRAAGFNTPTLMAFGQEKSGGVVTRSFLLTAEIAGGVAAHDWMRQLQPRARRELLGRIAKLTARFQAAGFVHKDYYLSHIFVVPAKSPAIEPELYFIDLQRLARPAFLRERWRVKDLAQLGYAAQLSGATRADLMFFYRTCFPSATLGPRDKERIRRIAARMARLHRRGPKHDVIWDQPGVRPPNV